MEKISSLKRVRDEDDEQETLRKEDISKRQKSYRDIITLLEEDEDESNDDLSSLMSTLQEEIISTSSPGPNPVRIGSGSTEPDPVQYESGSEGVEEVMRHLLEASDDELGLPKNKDDNNNNNNNDINTREEIDGDDVGHVDGGDLLFTLGEGLWEFEDHEANNNNYYEYNDLLLQSEIFM